MVSKGTLYVIILFVLLLLSGGILTFFMPEVAAAIRLLIFGSVCIATIDAFMLGQVAARSSNSAPVVSAIMPTSAPRAESPQNGQRTTTSPPPTCSLAEITHELRTPVNLIVGFCETLVAPNHAHSLPLSYRHDIDAIYRNAKMLQQAIENVLSILKTEAQANLQTVPVERKTEGGPGWPPSHPRKSTQPVRPSAGKSSLWMTRQMS